MTENNLTKKERRGQFFTTSISVQNAMTSLVEHGNDATVLEPSAGRGDLVIAMERQGYTNITAIEYDNEITPICNTRIHHMSFFDIPCDSELHHHYDVIMGNPPYVAWKNLEASQQDNMNVKFVKKRYTDKCNFYFLFIDRSIDLLNDNGELIFIVPKEWLYSTSAGVLRQKITSTGAITHIIDINEEQVFDDATPPAMMIFRYVKNKKQENIIYSDWISHSMTHKTLFDNNNHWMILDENLSNSLGNTIPLGTLYTPRVGIVSGADNVYRVCDGISNGYKGNGFVRYITTKGIQTFIDPTEYEWDDLCAEAQSILLTHKNELRERRIMKITDDNWFRYGAVRNRDYMLSDTERFYVLNRTRNSKPFFDDKQYRNKGTFLYSGGVLGMFRNIGTPTTLDKQSIIEFLNSNVASKLFVAMGITTGTKKTFMPSTVSEIPIPKSIVS